MFVTTTPPALAPMMTIVVIIAAGVTVTVVEAKACLGSAVLQATFHSKGVTYIIKFLFSPRDPTTFHR